MKLKRSIGLAILILTSSFVSTAESFSSTGKLTGLILDQGGARVSAAKIIVHARGFRRELVSAGDGSYQVALPKGKYTVTVTCDGFSPVSKEYVRIKWNGTTKLDITLVGILIEEFPVQMEELRPEPMIINNKILLRKPKAKP
jgi:hypothetical protein